MKRNRAVLAIAAAFLSLAQGCASARMSDHASDGYFRAGEYDKAIESLKAGLEDQGENGRDQLLYLLDLGLTLHMLGRYEESNQVFQKADKIAEIKDYTSLATEAGTLLTSENIKDYKGEDFEKVLINTYQAINYALIGDYENALVECRLVNRKLELMITEGQRKYKQNAFARYLSAIIYEAERDWNGAYVDYKKTRELEPALPGLGRDLWRLAWIMGMPDEMERWENEYRLTKEEREEAKLLAPRAKKSEIIVIYQNGISPIKGPNPDFYSLPRFFPRYNPVRDARVVLNGEEKGVTVRLHDIESTAISNLDENYAAMVAKKIGGMVAKEVVAKQIENATGERGFGMLAKLFFYVSDQADVRSWNLLPRDLQIARIRVEPGMHTVKIVPNGDGSSEIGEKTIQVEAGKKAFVSFRYVPR